MRSNALERPRRTAEAICLTAPVCPDLDTMCTGQSNFFVHVLQGAALAALGYTSLSGPAAPTSAGLLALPPASAQVPRPMGNCRGI